MFDQRELSEVDKKAEALFRSALSTKKIRFGRRKKTKTKSRRRMKRRK